MEVILLERVAKLGQMGDVVKVKDDLPATSFSNAAKPCARLPTIEPNSTA